jgi:glycosyltransferase involved in cell wall biosynthesis
MAAGRPIVATAVGATPELIEDGEHGLLVPPGDAERLAGAIDRLLRQPDLAQRLGAAARRRARERYSRAAMVRRFEELYVRLGTATAVPGGSREREASGDFRTRGAAPDVLTDVPGKPGRFWGDHTTCVGPSRPPRWLLLLAGWRWAHNLTGAFVALRLFARRHRYQGVVSDGGSSGLLFAWLQALCPWGRKPHVLVDCNWYRSPGRLGTWLKGFRLRLAARSAHRFVVWASHEVEDYAEAFGLPREKLEYVPFHTTLNDYQYEVREGDYPFAGGNYDRDYPGLVEAVRGLDVPTWIATTLPEQLSGVELPPNVRVEGTSAEEFRQALAGARLVVVPMKAGLLHSGGQQTCLNALALGKPTIAVGRNWARDLIEDGDTGLIVEHGDVAGLRRAVRWVLDHPDEARRMGERGRAHAARFTTQRTMQAVYDLVKSAAALPAKEGPCHVGARA